MANDIQIILAVIIFVWIFLVLMVGNYGDSMKSKIDDLKQDLEVFKNLYKETEFKKTVPSNFNYKGYAELYMMYVNGRHVIASLIWIEQDRKWLARVEHSDYEKARGYQDTLAGAVKELENQIIELKIK